MLERVNPASHAKRLELLSWVEEGSVQGGNHKWDSPCVVSGVTADE